MGFGNADGPAWGVSGLGLLPPAVRCTSEQTSSTGVLLLYLLWLANPKVERIGGGGNMENSQSTWD